MTISTIQPARLAEARRNVQDADSREHLAGLLEALTVLPYKPADFPIEDDPGLPAKDRPVLLAAIVSHADYLLTGDATHFGACYGRTISGVRIARPGGYLREE
ncbi:MAG: hypothetical protein IBX63_08995 [Coriobacteriia bacterium]|nr:hypothetical protein [Coriobacteriia bacterium]